MNLITLFPAVYALLAAAYLLFYAVASFFGKPEKKVNSTENKRILILLPVYKEDQVILESARKALTLHYDRCRFDVAVIADSLQPDTHTLLQNMGCIVVNMNLTPRSKAKAINLALNTIEKRFDICLVLDADNYLPADALIQINSCFAAGALAVQCQRVAKEITTPVSVLDAISEGINNAIFRKGHRTVGLSAALAGSGMAFSYELFKIVMSRIEATNGFDKDLEFEVISSGVRIKYLESVSVYDEKVGSLEVLKKQRTRWFAAQLINIKKGLFFFIKSPSIDLLDKWVQMFLPSRLLLFGLFLAMTIVSVLVQLDYITVMFACSTIAIALALVLATPFHYLKGRWWPVIIHLPLSFFTLIISFLSIARARKGFIHTPHSAAKI